MAVANELPDGMNSITATCAYRKTLPFGNTHGPGRYRARFSVG